MLILILKKYRKRAVQGEKMDSKLSGGKGKGSTIVYAVKRSRETK